MLVHQSTAPAERSLGSHLVAEANHRIANSLSAIGGVIHHQTSRLKTDRTMTTGEVRQLLDDVKARIDTVARLHRTLSTVDPGAHLDLGAYLPQIASQLVTSLSRPNSVVLHCVCQLGCRAAPERARYLGLILVELITNSIKYAHPAGVAGKIELSCQQDPDGIVVEVADDGVGFPEGFDPHHEGSSGVGLAHLLAKQIGAELSFHSDGLGLRCIIRAPID